MVARRRKFSFIFHSSGHSNRVWQKSHCKLYTGVFGVAYYESVIIFSKFKIADQRWWTKSPEFRISSVKIGISEFSKTLVTNPSLGFPNSIWRIQDVRKKFSKSVSFCENFYIKVFEVDDYECVIRFPEFKVADPRWRTKNPEFRLSRGNWYARVFEDTDYESVISFLELKMADPRWWTKIPEFRLFP